MNSLLHHSLVPFGQDLMVPGLRQRAGSARTKFVAMPPELHRADGPVSRDTRDADNQLASEWQAGLRQGVVIGAAVLALVIPPASRNNFSITPPASTSVASATPNATAVPGLTIRAADFKQTLASTEARQLANWIVASGDNQQRFFVLIDKKNTHVFVFDSRGVLVSSTSVLIGAATGDDSVAGIGNRPIANVAPHERTTPAGRFNAERGRNTSGEDVIWVDYDAAVSMHRVRAIEPAERRLERLASPGTDDNRISYGCINIPVRFYEGVIAPAFLAGQGVVYVMPEVKPLAEVFAGLDEAERLARPSSSLQSPSENSYRQ